MTDIALAFDHYAIFVDDLARSVEFYRNVLGLEEIPDPFRDGRHVWFRIEGNQQLHIITPRKSEARPTSDVHFAFRVASLDAFRAHLESAGIATDQHPYGKTGARPDGVGQIFFQDPDGHWIEVNEAKY